jgi:3(or 17)beta-hydroxysteroid dehydrogenase
MGLLDGKVALITGGASGIGRATARAFAREGARVAISDLNTDGAAAVADELKSSGDAIAFTQNAASEDDWDAAIASVADGLGPLDILVNNAGVLPHEPLLENTSLKEWRRVCSVNVDGVFLGVRAGIRSMRERGGAIVNLASIYGLRGATKIGAYAAAKHAVVGLTKSAAMECADLRYPIRINAICPGFIDTGMTDQTIEQTGLTEFRELSARMTPIRRIGQPEEIAEGIVYLASERASFVTGTQLAVDGGFTAR